MRRLSQPLRYVPHREVGDRPNIVVDGAPLKSTVLTLSHWPNNATPEPFKRDTSTETVFAWLDSRCSSFPARIATNNHFDEDGLFSMFALHEPRRAERHRELLIDASRAGDFGVYRRRDAARLCFTIEALADPARSPLPRAVLRGPEAARVAALYRYMLPALPRLLAHLARQRPFWAAQDAHLDASERLLATRQVVIEEDHAHDLATVRIPPEVPERAVRRYLRSERAAVHPFAINSATHCTRLLLLQGRRMEMQYRYESWLQIASRRPAYRVDLTPFCRWLNRRERNGRWIWEDTLSIVPRLHLSGGRESSIMPQTFSRVLRSYLETLPVAWDPYHWKGR